jgi:hypothetical protein
MSPSQGRRALVRGHRSDVGLTGIVELVAKRIAWTWRRKSHVWCRWRHTEWWRVDAMTSESPEGVAPAAGMVPDGPQEGNDDGFLRMLVRFCNETGAGIALTVHAGGTIVSGTLISDTKFYQLLAKRVRTALPSDESAEDFAGGVDQWARLIAGQDGKEEPNGEKPADQKVRSARGTSYLHLKDASIGPSLAELSPQERVLWRGRLSSIDGWMLGSFEPKM